MAKARDKRTSHKKKAKKKAKAKSHPKTKTGRRCTGA